MSAPVRVDLYTDASVKGGKGGWAFVIVIEGTDPIEGSGRFRGDLRCTATAEARAVANALHRLFRSGHAEPGARVNLFCDHRTVVDRIAGRCKGRPESGAAKAVAVVHKMAADRGITLKAVWIKGHRPPGADRHAEFNHRCDKLCGEARRTMPAPTKARRALARARALEGRTA